MVFCFALRERNLVAFDAHAVNQEAVSYTHLSIQLSYAHIYEVVPDNKLYSI